MDKKIFANRLGLAISFVFLSLFPSTAVWAQKTATTTASAQGPQQVVVTNTIAQPVPMVGLVTDADNPARQPFQWFGELTQDAASNSQHKVLTAPVNQRLVIEDFSGQCFGGINDVRLGTAIDNGSVFQYHMLPAALWSGTGSISTRLLFYVDPGHDFFFNVSTAGAPAGYCYVSVSGYFISAQTLAN